MVGVLLIEIHVLVVLVAMMIVQVVRAVLTQIVRRVHKPMHSAAPIRYVPEQEVDEMIATQHRVTIISKNAGKMRVPLVRHAAVRVIATMMHQSVWSVTKNAHQHLLLLM